MAKAAIEHTFEFDESELYNEDASPVLMAEDMSEEEAAAKHDAEGDTESDTESSFQPEFDKLSANGDGDSLSSKSASLRVSIHDIDSSREHSPPEPLSKPALGTTYTKSFFNPRPVPSTRLGTSAPINIPHMSRWKLGADAAEQPPVVNIVAQTFVPPHQLSQKDDFMFSFTGASPSAVVKRDRLRQRNAILRSTGFLENGGSPASPVQQEPQRTEKSSLTAALSTIGEC